MRKLIKLINNERANITLLSKKAYYDKCAADAFDLCGTIDNAVCTLYAYDYCIKEDYAACSKGADDTCYIDYDSCHGPGAEDND